MATRASNKRAKTAAAVPGRPAGKAPDVPPSTRLSLAVQYSVDERARLPRWRLRRWVEAALAAVEGPAAVALTLRLVDAEEGRELNRDFRERDYATNVLTFEYGADPDGTVHGDIVVCVPVLVREAEEQGKPFLHHAAHLVVHATLHSLGYDHLEADEQAEMEALEIEILAGMAIPDPYQLS